jgi:UDP-N-acetylglucosamine 2-epimerase (non-hydrolysing)
MILIAFGTRPEWIKIKPVVDKINGQIPFRLLCTGQHHSLIDDSLKNYPVSYLAMENILVNRLDSIVTNILANIDQHLDKVSHVMVQGDTTSAFAVALAAFHRKIKIIHLEAGLRSWDKDNPYPEEFNRVSIGSMADVHLCPTLDCKNNLQKVKSIKSTNSKIEVVGNTVLDNLIGIEPTVSNTVFITLHRRENIDLIDKWFESINRIAVDNSHLEFIFPMHPNPEITKYKELLTHVKVIDPLPHKECVNYIAKCGLVITDSGGLQEESSFLKKKCIVCRKTTERSEGEGIFSKLCHDPDMLYNIFNMTSIELVNQSCPYGDGHSGEKILEILKSL